ncbi:hypothetical protein RUM44_008063 [Polyplax serrata]|uniref:Protein YIPF n=1 Tax=Polyplax serrata TaxID=468196 RepID=A0ABR1B7M1_POLSC
MEDTTLDFQHFEPTEAPTRGNAAVLEINQGNIYNRVSENPVGSDIKSSESEPSNSFWSFEYYQQFFDVDTDQVKNRIIWGMIPRPGVSYINTIIKPKPDLYGPFWISVTLIFTIAVSGNVANYLQFAPLGNYYWKYDFHIISFAATAIFLYSFVVPLLLWGFIKWNDSSQNLSVTFLELLCVYGYSLGIYIPVAILWVIQISWFQWILVLLGATMSGFVLLTAVAPVLAGPKKCIVLCIVLLLHFTLAVGFMLYFFHVPSIKSSPVPATILATDSIQVSKT